ncbi:MAG: hypothetical protein LH606_10710 [Cytophagaceae bacterium]|nr:hypothetical protein [Cytophagaceae bacterium]
MSTIEYIQSRGGITEEKARNQFATEDKVKVLISDAKVDLIKWMIGFWVTQMAALIGLYLIRKVTAGRQ